MSWTRRESLALALAAGCSRPSEPDGPAAKPKEPASGPAFLPDEMAVLTAVCDHLIPALHGMPKASVARVPEGLAKTLRQPAFADIATLVRQGLASLAADGFTAWTSQEQNDKLLQMHASKEAAPFSPARWVNMMVVLSIEAYFAGPDHPSNPEQMTWQARSKWA